MASLSEEEQFDALLQVFESLDDKQSVSDFLQDLLTFKEIRDCSSRLYVAKLLDDGLSYAQIEELTGASATTIARVSKCLSHGTGGYMRAMQVFDY